MKHKRSTDAIVALAKKKSEETAQQVEQAIKQLIKKNERINFNTVAVVSGVSKSYLYNHPNDELKCFVNNGNSHLEL